MGTTAQNAFDFDPAAGSPATPWAAGDISRCETRISAARVLLFREAPFFGSLASRLRPVPASGPDVETMGVMADGRMVYSPPFVLSLSVRQLAGGLAHEVMHLAGDVFGRRGERDPLLWNVAHDYAINLLIQSCGCKDLELPAGVLLDEAFRDMAAEEIYERLKKEQEGRGRRATRGAGRNRTNPLGRQGVGCADHADPENRRYVEAGGQVADGMTPEDWKAAVAEAAEAARSQGKFPAGLSRWLGQLLTPQLDWRTILARSVTQAIGEEEFTYRRPSRRSFAAGRLLTGEALAALRAFGVSTDAPLVMLPGTLHTGHEATLALDTSASIGQEDMTRFASEAEEIMQLAGARLTVYCCDAEVASEIDADSVRDVAVKGGGGTSFVPVFQRIQETIHEKPCRMLVYFTDLHGTFPSEAPPYPVIWVVPVNEYTTRHPVEPPFGTALRVRL